MRVMMNIEVEGSIPYPSKLSDHLDGKWNTVVSMLQGRAEQLTLEGKYKDAEHIYTHILDSSKLLQSTELSLEFLPNLVSIYEKTGNLSAAEAAQESLFCLAINSDVYGVDEVTLEAEKLRHFYALFYDRIRNIVVQHGDDQIVSADFARSLVFCRVTALDYDASTILSDLIEIPSKALHIAVTAGAPGLIPLILDYGSCDVNTTDGDGNTALHIAVRGCQAGIVQLLLDRGIDLEVVNKEGDTALLLALNQTSEQAFGITTAPLDRGSDPKVTDSVGRTALRLAARSGTPGLEADAPDIKGTTPLMIVAVGSDISSCVPIAQQLLESGANVNALGDEDGTPLMRASRFGNIEMVQLLIARGANVESRDSLGRTALHMALERTTGTEREIISILIKAQIDTEAKDHDGRTALHIALERTAGTEGETISILLQAQVDLEAKDKHGRSALGVASKRGNLAVARQLLEHGADVEAEFDNEKLLTHVVRLENESATKLLLERGANVHTRSSTGATPLMVAVCAGRRSIVRILLDAGANVSKGYQLQNGELNQLLHFAIINSDLPTVEMLLDAGPHAILAVNFLGNTPIHQVILGGRREPDERILNLLLERFRGQIGIFTEVDVEGNTPLHLAVMYRKHEMAKMLLDAQSSPDADTNLSMRNSKTKQVYDLVYDSVVHETNPEFSPYWELRQSIRSVLRTEGRMLQDLSNTEMISAQRTSGLYI